jgi:hypothetical protein
MNVSAISTSLILKDERTKVRMASGNGIKMALKLTYMLKIHSPRNSA